MMSVDESLLEVVDGESVVVAPVSELSSVMPIPPDDVESFVVVPDDVPLGVELDGGVLGSGVAAVVLELDEEGLPDAVPVVEFVVWLELVAWVSTGVFPSSLAAQLAMPAVTSVKSTAERKRRVATGSSLRRIMRGSILPRDT